MMVGNIPSKDQPRGGLAGVNASKRLSIRKSSTPASCYMILMTYPVNTSDMWARSNGTGACHTSQVEEALQAGFTVAGRHKALYLDSVPMARSVTGSTKATNENQQETFRKGFQRVIASGCKVIIVRHAANRIWLSKMLAHTVRRTNKSEHCHYVVTSFFSSTRQRGTSTTNGLMALENIADPTEEQKMTLQEARRNLK